MTLSGGILKTSNGRDRTTCLGSPFQCLTVLSEKPVPVLHIILSLNWRDQMDHAVDKELAGWSQSVVVN